MLTNRNSLNESSQTSDSTNEKSLDIHEDSQKRRKRKLSDFVEMYDRIKENFQIDYENGDSLDDKSHLKFHVDGVPLNIKPCESFVISNNNVLLTKKLTKEPRGISRDPRIYLKQNKQTMNSSKSSVNSRIAAKKGNE